MKAGLIEAFKRYSKLVLATLRNNQAFDERLGATVIPTSSRSRRIEFLPKVVERLEREEDFCQLIMETRAAFPDRYHTYDDYWTREAVQNFFRRSDFYLDVFAGKGINIEGAFERYVTAFQDDKTEVTCLTLLEGVEFTSPIACMNFNTFQIRRFSAEELANIVGNQINKIFYPRAVIDVKRLQDYWFLSTTRPQPRSHPIRTLDTLDWSRVGQIEPYYQSGAEELRFGSPTQILALFAWEAWDEIELGRGPCDLPLVLRFDDDLLSSPAATPNLSHLQTGIWVNPDTEEEIEYPALWLHLDSEGTDQFNTFVQRIEHLFGSLKPQALGWEFLEIGLAYYMKALQSTGLEQLLWHMTALEALLGERGEGITERLARRISMILGGCPRINICGLLILG
jgi:hypothetical protein